MATGTVKKTVSGIAAPGNSISFPFTPTSDGFITMTTNMSSSAGGYARIDQVDGGRLQLSSAGGTGNSGCLPVLAGKQCTLTMSNCTVIAYFFALI